METLFDYAESCRLRDEALARVIDHSMDWQGRALNAIRDLPVGWEGIGESVRQHVSNRCGEPHSANCWGALVNTAMKRGLLRGTGRLAPMTTKKSHARLSQVLERVSDV